MIERTGRWHYRRSLASRVALLTTMAVGASIALMALGAFMVMRMQLQSSLDESLLNRARLAAESTALSRSHRAGRAGPDARCRRRPRHLHHRRARRALGRQPAELPARQAGAGGGRRAVAVRDPNGGRQGRRALPRRHGARRQRPGARARAGTGVAGPHVAQARDRDARQRRARRARGPRSRAGRSRPTVFGPYGDWRCPSSATPPRRTSPLCPSRETTRSPA
ncbi:hypothetical protein [Nocardioides sp. B-3]|uniref:hypothetical protein n=1 Tax=Nocardioides sp. B-3 TaxID=2895565 RepID=UPI0021529AFB|nr:hypothetical protein [Nocardioides sp. B-3]UUZ61286.1 hypothetical protein LP418_12240 [Nocardioides sp. B-3]